MKVLKFLAHKRIQPSPIHQISGPWRNVPSWLMTCLGTSPGWVGTYYMGLKFDGLGLAVYSLWAENFKIRHRISYPEKSLKIVEEASREIERSKREQRLSCKARERERERRKMASFLQSLIDPKKNWLAAKHMKTIYNRLKNYGQLFQTLIF